MCCLTERAITSFTTHADTTAVPQKYGLEAPALSIVTLCVFQACGALMWVVYYWFSMFWYWSWELPSKFTLSPDVHEPYNHSPCIVLLRQLSFQGFCPEASTILEVMEQNILACCSDVGTQLALVLAPWIYWIRWLNAVAEEIDMKFSVVLSDLYDW